MIKKIILSLALSALGIGAACAQTAPAPPTDPFQPIQFLVGKWSGGGKTDSGQAQGTSVFKEDLQGHVLVRRDSNGFAGQGKNAAPYEQMMVIAPAQPGSAGGYTASYWDSVGHVISYNGTVSTVNGMPQVQFLSAATPNAPQFRLTYTETGPKAMHVRFEIEPPGSPAWHTIAEGDDMRVGM